MIANSSFSILARGMRQGYYPYGNKFFSDLVHYVRSGDFVAELIRDSENINELAFALGALAHNASDTTGHPVVNEAVSLTFPKLRNRYGNEVTYAEDPKAHIRTEFGFDVVQVAQQHYTSQAYHDFIGRPTGAAEYSLADKTYARLLKQLAKDDYAQVTPALRTNLLDFYNDLDHPIETRRHKDAWNEVLRSLDALKKQAGSGIQGNL